MTSPRLELDLTQQEPIPPAGVEAALALMASGKLHRYGEVGGKPSEVSALEADFARELGVRYCVAMNSCGSTMFVALKAAGVKPGDAVLSNCFTLAPVPGAMAHAGARPVLVDVTDDYTIDLDDLERKAAASGAKVAAAVAHARPHRRHGSADRDLPPARRAGDRRLRPHDGRWMGWQGHRYLGPRGLFQPAKLQTREQRRRRPARHRR